MDVLKEYVMDIGYFMVFSSLVRLFMPSGSFRAYINMFLGLIFMLIILNPISAFIKTGLPSLEDYIIKSSGEISEEMRERAALNENEDIILKEYSAALSERIMAISEGYIEDPRVEVTTDETLKPKAVKVTGKGTALAASELKAALSHIYGIEIISIEVEQE